MFGKSDKDFDRRLKQVKREKELFDREAEIRQIKRSMRRWNPPTTTKLLMAIIFINCAVVEIYSMAVMWLLMDLSALYALITAVITESISFAVYAAKAYAETKEEEQVKLAREKLMMDHSSPAEDGMDESADPEAGGTETEG